MRAPSRRIIPWLALSAILIVMTAIWATRTVERRAENVATPTSHPGFEGLMEEVAKQSKEAPRASAVDATATATEKAPTSKTGRLQLRVTDALSGAPLAGATCRVYTERNGNVTFGILTTDADGRASIGELPENTILVHVERRPPHASTFAGVWLRDGESRDLEVKVGAGGTVVGRAVDETGKPLAGVEVFLVSDKPIANDTPEARTSSDGRFELACVVSHPRSVWIVDGAMRPESWSNVRLRFLWGKSYAAAEAQIEDGKRVDLGDVLLERPNVLSGRVLDARRAPVHDALIAANVSPLTLRREALLARTAAPSAEPVNHPRTRVDGAFEIEASSGRTLVVVATVEGIIDTFPIQNLEPGERRSDLEFVLDDVTILELELNDLHGKRVTRRPKSDATEGVSPNFKWGDISLKLGLTSLGGRSLEMSQTAEEDELFRFQLPSWTRAGGKLRVEMPGFRAVDAELSGVVGLVERRSFSLAPLPVVRVHLRVTDPEHRPVAKWAPFVLLQACLIDPVTFTEGANSSAFFSCCGLGSTFRTPVREFERDVDLPVRSSSERYWIHALVLQRESASTDAIQFRVLHETHLGPFAPDDTRHAVEITAPDVKIVAEEEPARVPPEPTTPANERVNAGRDEAPDAGKMRLWFVESDGRPVEVGTDITLFSAVDAADRSQYREMFGEPRGQVRAADGSAAFQTEVRGACTIAISQRRDDDVLGRPIAFQAVEVDVIEAFADRAIRLAAWRTVEIHVSGAAADLPEASLQMYLDPRVSPAFLPARRQHIWLSEGPPLANRERRFRAIVTPGNYDITLKSGLFGAPSTSIEVRNEDALQVFQLSSTRR